MDKDLLDLLVCPVCRGDLIEEDGKLICQSCAKKYPVRNGVPILLADEAQSFKQE